MEATNIVDFARRDEITDALTDLLRTGAQQQLRPNLPVIWHNFQTCALRQVTRLSTARQGIAQQCPERCRFPDATRDVWVARIVAWRRRRAQAGNRGVGPGAGLSFSAFARFARNFVGVINACHVGNWIGAL